MQRNLQQRGIVLEGLSFCESLDTEKNRFAFILYLCFKIYMILLFEARGQCAYSLNNYEIPVVF